MAFSSDDLLKTLYDLAEGPLKKNADRIDDKHEWPADNIEKIKESGLAGLLIPREFGGHGQGLLTMVRACEILGATCASTSMCFGMHLVGSAVIASKATKFHQEEYLKPIAEGKHWTTLSLSEPGTGAHFYIPESEMVLHDGRLILNGEKSFVTNGGEADSYVMSVVVPAGDHSIGEFSCVIVPGDSDNMEWSRSWEGIGMRGNSSKSVKLKNVSVRRDNLLGNVGDEIWYVFEVVAPNFLMAMSGTYLGIATAALNEAKEYLIQRSYRHTGAALASLPILQHRIGALWSQVERTRQLIYSAASLGDRRDERALLSIMSAKAEVAECVVTVVNECMTLMGGESYAQSGSMGRHMRDARAAHVMAPTTDILRTWIGRALLGQPLLGD